MGFKCYFCEEKDRTGYWSNWCEDCANLRRLLLIYEPQKCIDILKRTLTRDDTQINYKVQQEIKKIVNNDIESKGTDDDSYLKRTTRSNKSKNIEKP